MLRSFICPCEGGSPNCTSTIKNNGGGVHCFSLVSTSLHPVHRHLSFQVYVIQWANFINEQPGRADSLWCIDLRYEGQTTTVLIKVVAVWGPTSGFSLPPSDSLWSQKRRGKLSWSKARLSLSENDGRWKACLPLQRQSCTPGANSKSPALGCGWLCEGAAWHS